jgi:PrgI family protein
MQFRVPQFIDVEDKIVGPFTLKQFAYLLGAGGLAFLLWTLIPIKLLALIIIAPVSGLFIALAFVKINERPLIDFLENMLTYYTGAKIFTWKQATPEKQAVDRIEKVVAQTQKKEIMDKAKGDKLHDVSLGLDVLDRNSQE